MVAVERYGRTQSPVALAMSSPTFFGDSPRGPIFGARADEAPTSPPVALKVLHRGLSQLLCLIGIYLEEAPAGAHISLTSFGSY